MSYKTKWAPKPPPEPVITGSLAPEPKEEEEKALKNNTSPLIQMQP